MGAREAAFRRIKSQNRNKRRRLAEEALPATATYTGRNQNSGYREIQTIDGGIEYANYLSSATPPEQLELYLVGRRGNPGSITTRNA